MLIKKGQNYQKKKKEIYHTTNMSCSVFSLKLLKDTHTYTQILFFE